MARIGIIFGLALCGLTVSGLVISPVKDLFQFAPMMLGIPILFCGVVALNPHRRPQAMHISAAIAVLGAIGGLCGFGVMVYRWVRGESVSSFAVWMVLTMIAICLVFSLIFVAFYLAARRRRERPGEPAGDRKMDPPGNRPSPTPELETTAVRPDRPVDVM